VKKNENGKKIEKIISSAVVTAVAAVTVLEAPFSIYYQVRRVCHLRLSFGPFFNAVVL
jgi:hypothetical protein